MTNRFRTRKDTALHRSALLCTALLAFSIEAGAELPIGLGSQVAGQTQTGHAPVPHWVYTLRQGETVESVASKLLASPYTAAQLSSYNQSIPTTAIHANQALRIPLAWLKQQPEPATATSVSGQVRIISSVDGRQRALTENTLIRVGDEILSRSGNATIELADRSVVRIGPNSRVIFNKLTQYGQSGMTDTRIRLNHGEIDTQVIPRAGSGARFEVETPSAVAAVRGTAFAMQAQPGTTALQVTEGVVSFGPTGRTRNIPAGYSALVDSRTPSPVSIFRLPPAPVPVPLAESLQSLPASLDWAPDGASQHRVDIYDADNGRWLKSDTVNGQNYELNYLDNGRYHIRLAALDNRGVAGLPATLSVDVALQARPATLEFPTASASVSDDMPEFRWHYQGHNEVARVEIAASEDFSNLITTSEWAPDTSAIAKRPLNPGQYYWRVVTEAGGTSVATSEPRALVINGSLPPVRIISINYVDSQVRVFWESTDTATGYLMQLAEEPKFQNVIKEATVKDTTAALRLIPGRRYFVRLKALSDGPATSRWGPGRELFIE
ncbi:FecR family protein [Marinobacter sp. SS21]|uniref:FecR family protein n=1 Tax=Marinobacter sp. SS21 TaxID=2979460 RepID=UPI00232AD04C|nr:FecR family protein [Marinobacter sp. SS21]MDC0664218.1 FecR family protein [Marinobacter sp. SS21]